MNVSDNVLHVSMLNRNHQEACVFMTAAKQRPLLPHGVVHVCLFVCESNGAAFEAVSQDQAVMKETRKMTFPLVPKMFTPCGCHILAAHAGKEIERGECNRQQLST